MVVLKAAMTREFLAVCCVFLLSCIRASLQDTTNLLLDPDFENADHAPWHCASCTLTSSRDSQNGKQSVSVTQRGHIYSSPGQTVNVKAGHRYYFRAYVKLLNQLPGHLFHHVEIMCDCVDSKQHHHYNSVGRSPHIQKALGWRVVGGDFLVPSDITSCKVYLKLSETKVNFLFDNAVMAEIPQITNLKAETDARIENLRKADVNFKFLGSDVPHSGLSIQLIQTYSEFIIGSAIDAAMIVDPAYKKYQEYFYDNFEWGVPSNSLKWTATEHNEGHVDYSIPMKAVDALLARGKKVKGHNIFWDIQKHVPKWQLDKTGSELKPLMLKRIQGAVGTFKGKLSHWDVDNENLHGEFYEEKLQDANITMWMFRETHKVDPEVKLFLNDYSVVSNPSNTFALRDQAALFKESGVPVYGVGIQSHIHPPLDIAAVKFRLDQVAQAGLPIMITELDVDTKDENLKARMYEDLYRLYFSHPAVMGIFQWHYWSGRTWKPHAVLTDGPDITPNQAGRIVRQLVWSDWRTNHTELLTNTDKTSVKAFKGDYLVRVLHKGQIIHEQNLTLDKYGLDVTVLLNGKADHLAVSNLLIG